MQINLLSPTDLFPYEKNPRNNENSVEIVAKSIQEYGFRQPIVVDEDNIILAGHTRHRAALQLGLDKVPVHIATGLSEAQKTSFRLMDNRSAELSTWDRDLLKSEMEELSLLDFDMTLTGFSLDEIAKMTNSSLEFFIDTDDEDEDLTEEITSDYQMSNIKMIHLYFNEETEPKFREMCNILESKMGTENMTDTVFKVMENAVNAYKN
ncbi:MAG: ParB N-terminal domain-containing protein [Betaproteobacteria bacterium]